MGVDIAYQGVMVTVLVMASYFIGHFMETGNWEITNSAHGMTMAFLTMSMAEVFHSFNMRSRHQSLFKIKGINKTLCFASAVSFILTTTVCEVPFLANAFGLTSVGLKEYLIAIGLGFLIVPLVELLKFIRRRADKQ